MGGGGREMEELFAIKRLMDDDMGMVDESEVEELFAIQLTRTTAKICKN